jgi:mortality factor 4-like protein 1
MSKLYGVEHLVRLLVKMPELVSYVNVGDGELTRIRKQLTAFEGFLAINANTLWTTEYERIE